MLASFAFWFLSKPDFGKLPEGARLERFQKSPHYVDGKFQPYEPIVMEIKDNFLVSMYKFIFEEHPELRPASSLPTEKTDLTKLAPNEDLIVWMGHSSFYLQLGGKKILVDPVFSGHSSPLESLLKAFPGSDVYKAEELPDIDVLLLSHDHWDHLDYETITALKGKVKSVVCGLGVGAHLEYWGMDPRTIHEEDWDTTLQLSDLEITLLPTKHFSGRFLKGNQTLPVGFAIKSANKNFFYSGDSGYGSHFQKIGATYGPFDYAVIEDGQYDQQWHNVHMYPEETVQAAKEVGAKRMLPVHNSKFVLANHPWEEPLERVSKAASKEGMLLDTPKIGQVVKLDGEVISDPWWKTLTSNAK